jgi:HK97 family phage major capsid protein
MGEAVPIPTPNDGESEDDFISRCMGSDAMVEDYPDNDQRAAVCYSQYRERAAQHRDKTMSGLSEKHRELKRRRAEIVSKMGALVKQEDDADKPLSDEESSTFDDLAASLAAIDQRLQHIAAAMQAAAQGATEANGDDDNGDDGEEAALNSRVTRGSFRVGGAVTPVRVRRDPDAGLKDKRGVKAARFIIGLMHARYNKVSIEKAAEFISNRFGDDLVARALNSGITGEGGALIPQDFMADLIELLRASTAVRGSNPMEVGMPMGNLTIPRLAGGAIASYQNELDDITISQERFDDVNFVARKLTAMVPVSNDLIRRAPIGVEGVVRDDLVQTIARREDLAFLRGDGSDKGPIGMRSLALPANVITIAAMPATPSPGDQLTAIIAGASAAILALQNGMSRMIRPVWIMAPTIARFISTARDQVGGFYYKDEMERGTFEGYPVHLTQQIPTNLAVATYTSGSEVYFVDMADFVIADTYNVVVDASDVAAYNDGVSMVSAFQRDQSLFRVIAEHDCNMRHLQSLVVLLTQDWAFSGVPGAPGAPYSTQPLNPTWSQAAAIRPALATGANAPPTLTDPS